MRDRSCSPLSPSSSPMTLLSLLLFTLTLIHNTPLCSALYETDPNILTLKSSKEHRAQITESSSISLLQFYAPWCGHCQKFHPAYTKMAEMFKGIVTVAAVDASDDSSSMKRVVAEYGVTGFPTLKIVRPRGSGSKVEVIDVNSRDFNEIVNMVMNAVSMTIQERAGGVADEDDASGSSSSSNKTRKQRGGESASNSKSKSKSAVVELTSSNFASTVYQTTDVVAIAFIAPWCGHCKSLLPEWEQAASSLSKSGVLLATVDATAEQSLASEFGVQGYPTIKLFPGGNQKKSSRDAMDYQGGGRTKEMIVRYILDEVERSGVPKDIPEMTSAAVLDETCGSKGRSGSGNVICVVAALPHILDSGAEGRNKYKKVLAAASKAVRGMSFEFIWFEGGNRQTKLEQALDLTFGFPAMAAYSVEKEVYAVHRGSFTETNLRKFLMGITTGKMGTYPMRDEGKLVVVETEPWDGKDGTPIEEESLEDIMGWDDDDDDDDVGVGTGGEL